MNVRLYLENNERIDLDKFSSEEEVFEEMNRLFGGHEDLYIRDIGIGDYIDERIGSYNIHEDLYTPTPYYDVKELVSAFYRSDILNMDEYSDKKAGLFCAICTCEGVKHGLSVLCNDPSHFDFDYEYFPNASCSADIMEDVFLREYPEAGERLGKTGEFYDELPEWEGFEYEFMTGPFDGCEEYGTYTEKKYYEKWASQLEHFDYDDIDYDGIRLGHLLAWRPAGQKTKIPEDIYNARMGLLKPEDRELVEKAFNDKRVTPGTSPASEGEKFRFMYFGGSTTGNSVLDAGETAARCAAVAKDAETGLRIFKASAAYDAAYEKNPRRDENGAQPPAETDGKYLSLIEKAVEEYQRLAEKMYIEREVHTGKTFHDDCKGR